MTNAMGDALQNPTIQQKQNEIHRSQLDRAIHGLSANYISGFDDLPDLAAHVSGTIGNFDSSHPSVEGWNHPSWQTRNLERFAQNHDIIDPNFPQGQTYWEKVNDNVSGAIGRAASYATQAYLAKNLAQAIGPAVQSIPIVGPVVYGVGKAAQWLGNGITSNLPATAGAIAAPALADPYLKENIKNPTTRTAIETLLSVPGAYAGAGLNKLAGALGLPHSTPTLPEFSAAQSEATATPKTAKLMANQLQTIQHDPEAAQQMNEMVNANVDKVRSGLTTTNPISGSAIVDQIDHAFDTKIAQRAANYARDQDALFSNATTPVNTMPTMQTIDGLIAKEPGGAQGLTPISKSLLQAKNLIANAQTPMQVKNALVSINADATPAGRFGLSDAESAALRPVINNLSSDIKTAYPEFGKMQSDYAISSKELNDLKTGVIGGIEKSGRNKPSSVTRSIFEKTDPEKVGQVQDILGPDLYNQAADTYLSTTANGILNRPTGNTFNNAPNLKKLGQVLQNPQLQATLPQAQLQAAQQASQQAEQATRGVPSSDYMVQANAPNGIPGSLDIGSQGIAGTILKQAGNIGWNQKMAALQRQQMLTGNPPVAGQMIPQAVDMTGVVAGMNRPPLNPQAPIQQPQQMPQAPQVSNPTIGQVPMPPQQGHAPALNYDDIVKKYSGMGPRANTNQPGVGSPNVSPNVSPNPMQGVTSPQIMSGTTGTAPSLTAEQNAWVAKQAEKGNMNAIIDPLGEWNAYQNSSNGLEKLSSDKTERLDQLKRAATLTWPDNPTMQKMAITQSILESRLLGNPSTLASEHNNLFGIKENSGAPGTAGSVNMGTTEYYNGSPTHENANFSANNNIADSFQQHKDFLNHYGRYRNVLSAQTPEDAFQAIGQSGYATDPAYGSTLNTIYQKNVAPLYNDQGSTPKSPEAPKGPQTVDDLFNNAMSIAKKYGALNQPDASQQPQQAPANAPQLIPTMPQQLPQVQLPQVQIPNTPTLGGQLMNANYQLTGPQYQIDKTPDEED